MLGTWPNLRDNLVRSWLQRKRRRCHSRLSSRCVHCDVFCISEPKACDWSTDIAFPQSMCAICINYITI